MSNWIQLSIKKQPPHTYALKFLRLLMRILILNFSAYLRFEIFEAFHADY